MSVMDKTKKMVNQETFLQQRITKATESWKKFRKENKELEMKNVMFDCLSGKTMVSRIEKTELRDFVYVIEQYLKDVIHRIEILKRNEESSTALVPVAATTTSSVVMPVVEMGSSSVGFYDRIRDQIQSTLNMKQTTKDLDLNKKQW
ncbi:unnamed protein product [Arabidopsis arenosa]|uniref:Uncharacterized protein n=1 Tax=Arabidopsis arenosa TaxID=38785 RepID=A0A8S2ASC5_ARAAE|nr:unnamed protein product [Arabidopsis arenosa]